MATFGASRLAAARCHHVSRRLRHSVVRPGCVSPARVVPSGVVTPAYVGRPGGEPALPPRRIARLSARKVAALRDACAVARDVLAAAAECVRSGVTTDRIDAVAHDRCVRLNAYPSPLGYRGFPKSVCTSVNNVACHGIPDDYALGDGDIVNVDVTVFYKGYHGDTSATFLVGDVDDAGRHLVDVARRCRDAAIDACQPGLPFREIGHIISAIAAANGCSVVPEFCGHGIGAHFHAPPDIYHCENNRNGEMYKGMAFTIEPIVAEGRPQFSVLADGWTAVTDDDSRTAQFEHTILITDDHVEILT